MPRKTIDDQVFIDVYSSTGNKTEAYKRAGGKSSQEARQAGSAVFRRLEKECKAAILEKATSSIFHLVSMAEESNKVLQEALTDKKVSSDKRAQIALKMHAIIQDFIPKETIVKHEHTHALTIEEARETALKLLEQSGFGGATSGTIDVQPEPVPRLTGSGEGESE